MGTSSSLETVTDEGLPQDTSPAGWREVTEEYKFLRGISPEPELVEAIG